jgi:type III secretion system TyeA family effector delivery regulator
MSNGKAVIFARSVLDLIEGKVYYSELDDIAKQYSGLRNSDQLRFLNRLYPLLSHLPLALWESEEQRNSSLMECVKHLEFATIKDMGEIKFSQFSTNTIRSEDSLFRKKNKA